MKTSIVLPTLNEEKGVGKTIDSINKRWFKKNKHELEILIVDGNSKDKTREIAKKKGAKIIVEKRKGYGRAYKTGLPKTTGDIIVTGDADATYPFDKIHKYVQQLLDKNLDFITTDRFAGLKHGSMSIKHRFGNWILSTTLQVLFHVKIKDSQSGMWIFRKNALSKIQPLEKFNDGMPFSEEIKIEMFTAKNVKTLEMPSVLSARAGEAKIQSFTDGWKNLRFLFKKRMT
ncbi:glycosyl transferase [Thermoplasmatales archaeon SCGC AB-539-N05]|nr:glycosyl transferase [Thermoplasmatales archaeon SCGC AB-539-N05]ENO11805.1 glycosyl transferase [Thermoplasmatales archaeon SCGC AB-539-C06]